MYSPEQAISILKSQQYPEVELVEVEPYPTSRQLLQTVTHHILSEGQQVGRLNLKQGGNERWFNGIILDKRGVGYGPATYAKAIEESLQAGFDFRTDHWVTPPARHRWENLAALGVAKVVRDFKQISPSYHEGLYVVEAFPDIY